jgi:hypothetical protein
MGWNGAGELPGCYARDCWKRLRRGRIVSPRLAKFADRLVMREPLGRPMFVVVGRLDFSMIDTRGVGEC